MNNLISLINVCHSYHSKNGEIPVLENLSFEVKNKELLGIVGPSGCGKSTILSLLSRLIVPDSGTIDILDNSNKNFTGYMLQKDELFPWRNVLSNIMLGKELQNDNDKEFAIKLLEKYNLIDFKNSFPNQLSGGMRQRVALIRTLVLNPSLLLLDEPFSALDFQTRLNLVEDVYKMIRSEEKSAIFVTHDIQEAISMSDRILVLSSRPAKISIEVSLDSINSLSPLERRNTKEFYKYFELIYENLKQNSEKKNE